MKQIMLTILLLPFLSHAQNDSGYRGIIFQGELSWDQIKSKAKKENKYIFVDCYATWCKPCKIMDDKVYSTEKVGNHVNANMISVKVQMDSTKKDSASIQSWYKDAVFLRRMYNIKAFPSYLFFSPDGKIVHKGIGRKKPDDFLNLVNNAMNNNFQYYSLLDKYLGAKKSYSDLPYLAHTAKLLNEDSMANVIARDYKENYLENLDKREVLTKNNIEFISEFYKLINSQDHIFGIFYNDGKKVDEIINSDGFSKSVVDYIITREEINPSVFHAPNISNEKDAEPNWAKINKEISRKYGKQYADRTVLNAQIRLYEKREDWPKVVKYQVYKIEKYGLDTSGVAKYFLNNMIWDVFFMHCDDTRIINKGIKWMEIIVKGDSFAINNIDTYANLLYKVGRKSEAIIWEEKAVKLEDEKAVKFKGVINPVFRQTLEKMRRGEPTWIEN